MCKSYILLYNLEMQFLNRNNWILILSASLYVFKIILFIIKLYHSIFLTYSFKSVGIVSIVILRET